MCGGAGNRLHPAKSSATSRCTMWRHMCHHLCHHLCHHMCHHHVQPYPGEMGPGQWNTSSRLMGGHGFEPCRVSLSLRSPVLCVHRLCSRLGCSHCPCPPRLCSRLWCSHCSCPPPLVTPRRCQGGVIARRLSVSVSTASGIQTLVFTWSLADVAVTLGM